MPWVKSVEDGYINLHHIMFIYVLDYDPYAVIAVLDQDRAIEIFKGTGNKEESEKVLDALMKVV